MVFRETGWISIRTCKMMSSFLTRVNEILSNGDPGLRFDPFSRLDFIRLHIFTIFATWMKRWIPRRLQFWPTDLLSKLKDLAFRMKDFKPTQSQAFDTSHMVVIKTNRHFRNGSTTHKELFELLMIKIMSFSLKLKSIYF